MTEPGIGSDLASMTTTAMRDGDEYVLNGSKTFITNGINGDLVIVAAKTDPSQRHKGISLIVLESDTAGFERGRNLDKVGLHAQDTAELFFNDARVPAENLLGNEGEGFILLVKNLPQERLSIAMAAVAHSRAMLTWTVDYAKERNAFGQPIGSFQNSRFELAEMHTEITIAEVFLDRCIDALNRGELTAEEASMAKWWCTELQKRVGGLRCAAARRLRLHARVPDRPGLHRCPGHLHLRRDDRDHEGDHRPLDGLLIGTPVHTRDLDYPLPPDRIAQHPRDPRDAARLLVGPGVHGHPSTDPSQRWVTATSRSPHPAASGRPGGASTPPGCCRHGSQSSAREVAKGEVLLLDDLR